MLCGGNEVFFDATNPDARTYVWEKIKKNYYDQGAKLFWLDVAEPEYSVYDFRNYRYQLGSVQEVGNIYPKYYLKAFYDGMTADRHGIAFCRHADQPDPFCLGRQREIWCTRMVRRYCKYL